MYGQNPYPTTVPPTANNYSYGNSMVPIPMFLPHQPNIFFPFTEQMMNQPPLTSNYPGVLYPHGVHHPVNPDFSANSVISSLPSNSASKSSSDEKIPTPCSSPDINHLPSHPNSKFIFPIPSSPVVYTDCGPVSSSPILFPLYLTSPSPFGTPGSPFGTTRPSYGGPVSNMPNTNYTQQIYLNKPPPYFHKEDPVRVTNELSNLEISNTRTSSQTQEKKPADASKKPVESTKKPVVEPSLTPESDSLSSTPIVKPENSRKKVSNMMKKFKNNTV